MSKIESTPKLKVWRGSYDFAVDGGAVATLPLRSNDNDIPNGAIVVGGLVDVTTPVTSGGAATGALQVEAANDLVAQAVVAGAPWSTAGRKSIVPAMTGATAVKATASRNPSFVIGTAVLTAGKFDLVLFYL